MQKVRSDIMTHRGSHYDLGVKTALWLQTTPLLKIEIKNGEREFHVLILMSKKPMIYFKSIHHRFGKK